MLRRTTASVMQVCHDSGLVVFSSGQSVVVKDARKDYAVVFEAPLQHAVGLDASPSGAYLVTYQRPQKDKENEKNLCVFDISKWKGSGDEPPPTPVFSQSHKQASQDLWPLYQFDQKEEFMYRSVANEVHAIKTSAYEEGINKKLRVKGLSTFAISKGPEPKIAVYCPESKGAPGSVQVYDLESDFVGSANQAKGQPPPQPSARRSFYRSSR